jgi:hypothetical protein
MLLLPQNSPLEDGNRPTRTQAHSAIDAKPTIYCVTINIGGYFYWSPGAISDSRVA